MLFASVSMNDCDVIGASTALTSSGKDFTSRNCGATSVFCAFDVTGWTFMPRVALRDACRGMNGLTWADGGC